MVVSWVSNVLGAERDGGNSTGTRLTIWDLKDMVGFRV